MTTEAIKIASFETLKKDMQRLSDDFRKVLYSLGEKGKETIKQGSQRFGSALRSFGESAISTAGNACENIKSRGKEAVEKSRSTIALRPITYVFAALAAGVLAGAIIRRSRMI